MLEDQPPPGIEDSVITSTTSLALFYKVNRALASEMDLRAVLERILDLSIKAVGANSGSIIVLDANKQPVDSIIIFSGKIIQDTTRQLQNTLQTGLAGWVVRTGDAALLSNTSVDHRWTKRPDDAPYRTGAKSAIAVPIKAQEKIAGVMTLVHPTPGKLTDDHAALVQAIANQSGMAILYARLFAESQRKAQVMTALTEAALTMTAALGRDDLLQKIMAQVHRALRVESVSMAMVTPQRDRLEFVAASGPVAEKILGAQIKVGEGITGWVAKEGKGIVVPRAQRSRLFNPNIDQLTGYETQAIVSVPIRSQGRLIGVLDAINPLDGAFGPDAQLVLSGIGSLAGTVVKHTQLFESLQVANQRFQELFDDSIDPILITDWEGNIVQANRQASKTMKTSKERLQNLSIHQLHTVNTDTLGLYFENVSIDNAISYESTLKIGEEDEVPIEIHVRQIRLDEQDFLQWILRDISERKRLDTLRDDLVAMIYHDLRSPLSNVLYSLDVLEASLPDEEIYTSLIDVGMRSVERIQRLTTSLLDLKSLEAEEKVINRTAVMIEDMLNYAIDAVLPISISKQQTIDREIPEDLPKVSMDDDMIRRVAINLLENAVKYTPVSGKITVGAGIRDSDIQIWVKDTGPGIPTEQAETIFDKYARLDSADRRGFGLGLAFCRLAVIGHGGEIWVESELDNGSCFTFTLPLDKEEFEEKPE